ncbi:MAG TPA: ABC transporter ATP-binding protein, partial [Chloroflexota bacterium]|nr:ABC transporter ATP-binding protein [Chloroflexota bacterium]
MRGISKHFPGVVANQDVDFSARWGEVHALLGENGAGKSTLMSILAGLYRPDAGEIFVDGRRVDLRSPGDAIKCGIGMVYQHYKLVPSQTVAENLTLGLPKAGFRLNSRAVADEARELSSRYGLHVEPDRPVWQLSVGEQQRVEILKALQRGARVLVLDEPTAVLTPRESDDLMATLRRLVEEGRTAIFISHKLHEVASVADRVTVLRAGRVVGAGLGVKDMSPRELTRLMMGEEVAFEREPAPHATGPERLRLDGVDAQDDRGLEALRGITLSLAEGEILGIAGVAGNGQRELSQVIAGLRPCTAGRIELDGRDVTRAGAREMATAGLAYIPEDRMGEGLAGNLPLLDNALMRAYYREPVAAGPFLRPKAALDFSRGLLGRFNMQIPVATPARTLSGGQLQRFLLAREMALRPRVVVAVHPTRGLDVGATAAVHDWLLGER